MYYIILLSKYFKVKQSNPSLANYSGALYWAYTRKMGLLSAKLSANFLMDRLPHVTVGAARVASRRAFSYNSYVNSLETQRVMDLWAFSGRSRSARAGSSRFLQSTQVNLCTVMISYVLPIILLYQSKVCMWQSRVLYSRSLLLILEQSQLEGSRSEF